MLLTQKFILNLFINCSTLSLPQSLLQVTIVYGSSWLVPWLPPQCPSHASSTQQPARSLKNVNVMGVLLKTLQWFPRGTQSNIKVLNLTCKALYVWSCSLSQFHLITTFPVTFHNPATLISFHILEPTQLFSIAGYLHLLFLYVVCSSPYCCHSWRSLPNHL